jgi:hypothetical protein
MNRPPLKPVAAERPLARAVTLALCASLGFGQVSPSFAQQVTTTRFGYDAADNRAGCGNLNTAISEKAAPMGEDRARKDWSGNEQKTPAQPLCDLQGEGGG